MALESYLELQMDVPTFISSLLQPAITLQLAPQAGKKLVFDTFTPENTQYTVANPPQVGSPSLVLPPPAAASMTAFYSGGFGEVLNLGTPATAVEFTVPVTYHLTAFTNGTSTDAGLFNLVLTLRLSMQTFTGTSILLPNSVSATANQPTVTGTGFNAILQVGQSLTFASDSTNTTYNITAIDPSGTSLTIAPPYAGLTGTTTATLVPQMILAAVGATGGGANPAVAAALQAMLSSLQPIISNLSIGSLGNIVNVGAAVSTSTPPLIALRMQLGLGTQEFTQGMWNPFYTGANIANHLNLTSQTGSQVTGNISVFLATNLVVSLVQQVMQAGLAAHADKFQLQGGVATTWAPTSAGGAHLNTTFNGYVILPSPAPNVHVDVTVGTDISVATPPSDTLLTHSHFDWSVNLGDQILAVIVGGLGGFITGAVLTGGFGAIPGLAVGAVASIVATKQFTPHLSAPNCTQSGSDMTCTSTIQVPPGPLTTNPLLQFLSPIFGAADGMVLFSQLNIGPVTIGTVSVRNLLQLFHFNFGNGLRSLGTPVINAAYLASRAAQPTLPF
jgi:hypothetical protein